MDFNRLFSTLLELREHVQEWCKVNYHPIIVRTSSQDQLVFSCPHFIKRASNPVPKRLDDDGVDMVACRHRQSVGPENGRVNQRQIFRSNSCI